MNESAIPPTIYFEFSHPECGFDYAANKAREVPHSIALSNCLGFGSLNASVRPGKFRT